MRAGIRGAAPADLEGTRGRAEGARSYSIFLHAETRQLFGYAEIEDEARWAAVAQTPICRKWWAHMKELMPSNPDNSPKSIDLREVFHIEKAGGG